ncbi:nuclear transport factor 2 family protein [Mycobacterium sp. CVI_P3]|uniref:Nuclear transport factor 2 family protein n=1 Tax=Mycobacterium pinniadriaticum TaxID=2994102 RepID=A0ABT3SK14_9MYCO|nr:nuclear transport factor 2 family protein [Mycobacterium pinniadriaticum]MCX2933433.1 nuclear transport factor 2 family protein [Mycobacterium pinniadriaticum]MCX2939855.1 nuclear transport factor 2 family protein [Mycobacterium pinniadriaticum]
MSRLLIWALAPMLGVLVACGPSASSRSDADAIEAALRGFSRDFNNKDPEATCGLFAEDVVLNFPGRPPENGRGEFCAKIRTRFADPARTYHYDEPQIREVLVDGDLATVALIWTLTVRDESGRVLETVHEDGLDVFRRQPDGVWRIHISHAFPI